MTFLPIVTRELRVASRKRGTYWVRTGAGVVVVALGVWLFIVMQTEPPRDLAMGLFYVLTGSAVLYSLLSGLRTTADSLSEEKREGTLGLLFLTDLKGYDVVLGKLIASSVNAFYSVVAILPMLAIPLLMGGITAGEFARMSLVALNALFFSLAAGIWVSSLSRSAYRAMLGTAVVVVFFTGLLPAGGWFVVAAGKMTVVHPGFLWPSVGFSYYSALDQVYRVAKEPFWYSMGIVHSLGWALLGMASLISPHTWQDRPAGAPRQRWSERWKLWSYGNAAERAGFRRRLLESNPFFWLAARARIKPTLVWGFLALIACGWVWGLAKGRRAWLAQEMYMTTALFLNFTLRCWFAAEATRQLAEDRKSGTLELLLSTPLSVPEILHGQMLALARQFLGPVLVVLAVECLFMIANISESFGGEQSFLAWALYLAGMCMFVLDLAALYWVGMWQGLAARNQSRAITTTLGRILVVPWALIALVLLILAIASLGSVGGVAPADSGEAFFLGLWFLIGVLVDVSFAAIARHQLRTRFRVVAQQRYAARVGFWRSLFGVR